MDKQYELHVASTSGGRKHYVTEKEYELFVGQLQASREHAVVPGKFSYQSSTVLHTSVKELSNA